MPNITHAPKKPVIPTTFNASGFMAAEFLGEPKIVRTKNKKYRVRYVAANREIIAVSEVLNSRRSCYKNIAAMRKIFTYSINITNENK